MQAKAVIFARPGCLEVGEVTLVEPGAGDVVVDTLWSGISTGTERLLWSGRMPPFPGLGYPLVPGYETVGRITAAGPESRHEVGQTVFVPGSTGFRDARGLFGGAASRLVVPGTRVTPVNAALGAEGVLLALAATAYHAIACSAALPELIVGGGTLGHLMARITVALGGDPVVWEKQPDRRLSGLAYRMIDPGCDERRDYLAIHDASGDAGILDDLVMKAGRGAEIVLAGFYHERLSFAFPPAFMREIRLRVASEWQPRDMSGVLDLLADGRLSLSGLISHQAPFTAAADAYGTAFSDPTCLKMVLDWSSSQ